MAKFKPARRIGALEVIEVPGSGQGPWIVVFHGFSADASDLLSLAQLLHVPPGSTWLFPDGPLEVNNGGVIGRAWFPIDLEKWEEAERLGLERDLSGSTPPGLKTAREQVLAMLKAAGVKLERTVLMGFSQGSMVATDIALRSEVAPAALVIFSGALLNADLWTDKAKTKKGLPFFQSHGLHDSVLGINQARQLEKVLTDAGLQGRLLEFDGGHEIPQEAIFELNRFLKRVFSKLQQPGH